MDNLDCNFLVGKLAEALLNCLDRALNVSLDNNRKLLDIACLNLIKEVVKIHLLLGFLKHMLLLLCYKGLCNTSCFLLVLADHEYLTGIRHIVKT